MTEPIENRTDIGQVEIRGFTWIAQDGRRQAGQQIGPDVDVGLTPIDSQRRQWVHVFPWGEATVFRDGRGPFRLLEADAEAILARWAQTDSELLADFEHRSLYLDGNSTAAGWIQELVVAVPGAGDEAEVIVDATGPSFAEVRPPYPADMPAGIWALVQWTPTAAQQIADREYRYISPTFYAEDVASGGIVEVDGLGLTNTPAIRELQAVATEQAAREGVMPENAWEGLAAKLGIKAETEAEFEAAVKGLQVQAATADQLETDKQAAEARAKALEDEQTAASARQTATEAVEAAIAEGRLAAGAREQYIELYIGAPEATAAAFSAIPEGTLTTDHGLPPQGRQGAATSKPDTETEPSKFRVVARPSGCVSFPENEKLAASVLNQAKIDLADPAFRARVRAAARARRVGGEA
jgi:phage I-like protein